MHLGHTQSDDFEAPIGKYSTRLEVHISATAMVILRPLLTRNLQIARTHMCKHCKNEKNKALECICNCSDSEWIECKSERDTIQEELAWVKCKDCGHYLFLKAVPEEILVAREIRAGEYPVFRQEERERPYFIPGPVPRISA